MRRCQLVPLTLVAVVAGLVLAIAAGPASAGGRTRTLHYFFKQIGMTFRSPSGARVSSSSQLVPGDYFIEQIDAYTGDSAHHASSYSATASLECTVLKVKSQTDIRALCQAEIAIGSSMLLSTSEQNIAGNFALVPITGGTGTYAGARGKVHTTNVGKTNNVNAVVTFTT